jgi:hypothetical protein
MHCSSCLKPIEGENEIKRQSCFKCHLKSVRLGFVNGKESFHGETIRERQRYYEDSPAFKEGKIEKVSTRAELI